MVTTSSSNILKHTLRAVLVAATILIIHLIVSLFGQENWDRFDFIIAGIIIFSFVFLISLFIDKISNKSYRLVMIAGLTSLFVYIWAELAVGVFTSLGS